LLFGSIPMIAYLEAMKSKMAQYVPGLKELVTLPKDRFLAAPTPLTRLTQLLPSGKLFSVFVVEHGVLYLLVMYVAVTSTQYFVLGIQVLYPLYVGWLFVFLRVQLSRGSL